MEKMNIVERTITSSIETEGKVIVIENIKYPYFECDDEKDRALFEKMNSFYKSVSHKYSNYARGSLVRKISRIRGATNQPIIYKSSTLF